MKTDQASSPEELPGRLSEEDEDEHKDDPPNPVRYLSEVGFQSDQVGGFAISKIGEFSISKFGVFLFSYPLTKLVGRPPYVLPRWKGSDSFPVCAEI